MRHKTTRDAQVAGGIYNDAVRQLAALEAFVNDEYLVQDETFEQLLVDFGYELPKDGKVGADADRR